MKTRLRITGSILCALALTLSNAYAQTTPIDRSQMRPDEAGLWRETDRAEQDARASGRLIHDENLTNYIRTVGCSVMPQRCGELRFYVMNVPISNAFMAPNGYSEIWSGALLHIEDEAQLAFLLGHEGAHYTELHSIERWRAIRSRSNMALVASTAVAVAGVNSAANYPEAASDILDATGQVIDAINLITVASIFGFSRENEAEADLVGINRAIAAGYNAESGILFWENSIADRNASDDPDIRRVEARSNIFNTHPLTSQRIAALQRQTSGHANGETYRERYRAAIRPFLDSWLRAEIRGRDFGPMLVLLDRLGAHGEDLGVVEFYRGEIYRLRRGEGDRAQAKSHYQAAVGYADAPAAAWRELGDLERRDNNPQAAATHYRNYLERSPDAEDRALVEARIQNSEQRND
ncbi:MAG: M48 family metalloprotease [Terricaulis sp.]